MNVLITFSAIALVMFALAGAFLSLACISDLIDNAGIEKKSQRLLEVAGLMFGLVIVTACGNGAIQLIRILP